MKIVRKRKKRARKELEDRISDLPCEILVLILSLTTLKDAGRTSILSKRWKDLWKLLVRLDFDASEALDKIAALKNINSMRYRNFRAKSRRQYAKWVNILLESPQPLETLRICFDLDKEFKHKIDEWLLCAFGRGVNRLELNLLKDGERACFYEKAYALPLDLLGLNLNSLSEPAPLNLRKLRALTFRSVDVSGEALAFFLRSCPFLEHLAVESSNLLSGDFEVCRPSLPLKHLEISNCSQLKSISVHDIDIVSLKVVSEKEVVIRDLPKLANAWISGNGRKIRKVVSWISPCRFTLETLTLQQSCLDVKCARPKEDLPELIGLKQLNLVAEGYGSDSLIPLTCLMRISPNLEKFVVKLDWTHLSEEKMGWRRKAKRGPRIPLPNLRVVELLGYYGRIAEVEVVDYLLENAAFVERIVIDPRDHRISGRRRCQDDKEMGARRRAEEQLEQWIPMNPSVEFVLV